MRKLPALLLCAVLLLPGCFFIKADLNLTSKTEPLQETVLSGEGKDKILLMDISGMITSGDAGSLLGTSKEPGMVAVVREQLDKARADDSIKGLVLRIDSPGGGVTASDTIYHELRRFKDETKVPIIAHFTDTGASGAYYLALAADRITAQPTTITGSIGVTMLRVDATGLLHKIGLNAFQISSGPLKDMGSPVREVTPEETKLFQSMINDLFGKFVTLVASRRSLPEDQVRRIADGRVYASDEAKKLGLIDGIGYLEDAFGQAAGLAGIEKYRIVAYQRPDAYRPNIYAMNMNLFNVSLGELGRPGTRFTYLWMP